MKSCIWCVHFLLLFLSVVARPLVVAGSLPKAVHRGHHGIKHHMRCCRVKMDGGSRYLSAESALLESRVLHLAKPSLRHGHGTYRPSHTGQPAYRDLLQRVHHSYACVTKEPHSSRSPPIPANTTALLGGKISMLVFRRACVARHSKTNRSSRKAGV